MQEQNNKEKIKEYLSKILRTMEASFNEARCKNLYEDLSGEDTEELMNIAESKAIDELTDYISKTRRDMDRLQTQLAGCSVVALGGTKNPAKKGDYGWSQSYQDVLDLRLNFDKLSKTNKEAVEGFVDFIVKKEFREQSEQALREMSFISFDNRWVIELRDNLTEYLSQLNEKGTK